MTECSFNALAFLFYVSVIRNTRKTVQIRFKMLACKEQQLSSVSAKNQHVISTTLLIKAVLSKGTPSAEEENEERAYFNVQNDDVIKTKVFNANLFFFSAFKSLISDLYVQEI